ncbi:hypothetical protein QO058_30690 (plasmid) [Bosea vestrisii]|uniref:hypothetical protein n=1 Tax=Bosea vestrisii TaxID=151416 RepID=UPI0024DF3497|nr:hypothetical protein [Bosea vestrisii]WID99763.1 hypothetical protein QO058_30690 [Bosea vestrisii]
MKRHLAIILGAITLGLMLSACAYKPLKAPCGPDESGQPLAYAATPSLPEPFASIDPCGPMQPI